MVQNKSLEVTHISKAFQEVAKKSAIWLRESER